MEIPEHYRDLFPIARKYIFLNHAAVSSPSQRVVEAVKSLFDEFSECGIACYPRWMERIDHARALFARLLNAEPARIAFIGNTSDGLSAVAGGLDWKSGDSVLVPKPDFPANIYPWMNLERCGVTTRFFDRREGRFGVEDLEKALVPGTRLLAVSSVDYATGFRCDLEALGDFCRRKGLLFCVDAIQSLGVIPMDVKKFGIHFLAAGGHKWLLSTMGIGGLYISPEANDAIHPIRVGWRSVVDEEDFSRVHFDLKTDALRFETGTMNVAGITALGAALELLLEAGIENVRRKIFQVNDLLIQGLNERNIRIATPLGEEERSGILCFRPSSDAPSLNRYLSANNVMVSLRGENIRLAPHFYNNAEDVKGFFKMLDAYGEGE